VKQVPEKLNITAEHQRLTPEILATWEAEIRRIKVPGQPQAKKFVGPHLNGKNLGAMVCA
jgi:hypothetical protein